MASEYGALQVPVYANVRPLEESIKATATKTGTAAGQTISSHLGKGLSAVAPAAKAVGKAAAAGLLVATGAAIAFGKEAYKAAEEATRSPPRPPPSSSQPAAPRGSPPPRSTGCLPR